jgi:hypothetical protein
MSVAIQVEALRRRTREMMVGDDAGVLDLKVSIDAFLKCRFEFRPESATHLLTFDVVLVCGMSFASVLRCTWQP